MKTKATGYKVYFPDDGEGPQDAHDIKVYDWQKIYDAEHAAEHASALDYGERDGWERGMTRGECDKFAMVIIDPSGNESRYQGWHEASVEHKAERVDGDEDRDGLQGGEGQGREDPDRAQQESATGEAGRLDPTEGGA
jgi:hypothetical protein